jgi:predicted flap endonuclease-1-like 5' DNA nuclease
MTTAVKDLKGITETIAETLKGKGVTDNEQLVAAAATPEQRAALANDCECSPRTILELANRADLARIKGVSGVYSDLLERAGVDTVKELARRRADNLHTKIAEINTAEGITQRPPTSSQVEDWIAQAQGLPALLTY